MEELIIPLEIFGQQSFLNIYTQISLCFPLSDERDATAILDLLHEGRKRLAATFPWVAGQVVNEGATGEDTGLFSIKKFDEAPRLIVKNYRNDESVPAYEKMKAIDFPIQVLHESIFAPRSTLPGSSDPSLADVTPVFAIQANFLRGGLVLTFVGQHQTMDMGGQAQVIQLLAKACRNESFLPEEIVSGNRSRHDIVPFLDDSYVPGPEIADQIIKPSPKATPTRSVSSSWANLRFSGTSLHRLKSWASKDVASGFVSTDDALCALIWQTVTRCRQPRLEPETEITFARAVNVRSLLDIPQTYPGLLQAMTYSKQILEKLVEEPLGVVASRLRSALDPETSQLAYKTRAVATYLHRSRNKNITSVTASLKDASDVTLSSWAKFDFYNIDLGWPLGKTEAVRRPSFFPIEGLMYILPRKPDGEITVAMCLRDEDMERLKADKTFAEYATFVG